MPNNLQDSLGRNAILLKGKYLFNILYSSDSPTAHPPILYAAVCCSVRALLYGWKCLARHSIHVLWNCWKS